jgi:SPP1 family predicted phage head-tail adaptor
MNMTIPHPGQLRNLVEIGRAVNAPSENGYTVETEEVVCRVWASVEDGSSRYLVAGDAGTAARGLVFVIRWRGDVVPGMWVRFRDEKHRIEKVEEYDFKRRYLKLTTVSAKGVGG